MEHHEDNLKAELKAKPHGQESEFVKPKPDTVNIVLAGIGTSLPLAGLWAFSIDFDSGLGGYQADYSPLIAFFVAVIIVSVLMGFAFVYLLDKSVETQKRRDTLAERHITYFAAFASILAVTPYLYPSAVSLIQYFRIGFGTMDNYILYILAGLGGIVATIMFFVIRGFGHNYLKGIDPYWDIYPRKQKEK